MALARLEGLVLRSRDLGEADKIVVLFTRERGKMEAVARGARRARSRLLALAQPFTHGDFLLFLNSRGLHTLSQGEIIQPFRGLREDLTYMAYAAYFAEMVDWALPEEQPAENLLDTLLQALSILEAGEIAPSLVSRWFELHTLELLGYRPELSECVCCRMALTAGERRSLRFSVAEGGVLCPSCTEADPQAIRISGAVWQSMRFLLEKPSSRLAAFVLGDAENDVLERVLEACLEYRLERRLNSKAFLVAIEAMQ